MSKRSAVFGKGVVGWADWSWCVRFSHFTSLAPAHTHTQIANEGDRLFDCTYFQRNNFFGFFPRLPLLPWSSHYCSALSLFAHLAKILLAFRSYVRSLFLHCSLLLLLFLLVMVVVLLPLSTNAKCALDVCDIFLCRKFMYRTCMSPSEYDDGSYCTAELV